MKSGGTMALDKEIDEAQDKIDENNEEISKLKECIADLELENINLRLFINNSI